MPALGDSAVDVHRATRAWLSRSAGRALSRESSELRVTDIWEVATFYSMIHTSSRSEISHSDLQDVVVQDHGRGKSPNTVQRNSESSSVKRRLTGVSRERSRVSRLVRHCADVSTQLRLSREPDARKIDQAWTQLPGMRIEAIGCEPLQLRRVHLENSRSSTCIVAMVVTRRSKSSTACRPTT